MRIVVTGAGGFVGRHVLSELKEHDIVALDLKLEHILDSVNLTKIEGDLRESDILNAAFSQGCDAVIHLATVPGGAAETNPSLAKAINVDATMELIDIAAKTGNRPRFVFASSIAVFGKLPTTQVIDAAQTRPTMLYGAQKLMMENWIACQTRRGDIEGISLRLPGIVARPKSPSGMKSAFLSNLFHAIREGENFIMPVSPDATSWLCSAQTAAKNLSIAATRDVADDQNSGGILIPTQQVKMHALEQEIRKQLEQRPSDIRYAMDDKLQSIFGEHPDVKTPKAQTMGFVGDKDLEHLVRVTLKDLQK